MPPCCPAKQAAPAGGQRDAWFHNVGDSMGEKRVHDSGRGEARHAMQGSALPAHDRGGHDEFDGGRDRGDHDEFDMRHDASAGSDCSDGVSAADRSTFVEGDVVSVCWASEGGKRCVGKVTEVSVMDGIEALHVEHGGGSADDHWTDADGPGKWDVQMADSVDAPRNRRPKSSHGPAARGGRKRKAEPANVHAGAVGGGGNSSKALPTCTPKKLAPWGGVGRAVPAEPSRAAQDSGDGPEDGSAATPRGSSSASDSESDDDGDGR